MIIGWGGGNAQMSEIETVHPIQYIAKVAIFSQNRSSILPMKREGPKLRFAGSNRFKN